MEKKLHYKIFKCIEDVCSFKGGEEAHFYPSDEDEAPARPSLDPDHRLLLRNTKPLLQSRNAAVVLAVSQLYQHVAPQEEAKEVVKAMVRLLRSHREIQAVVLSNIASITAHRKGLFEPHLKSFFIRTCDPTHIKILKLEVITNLASETNIYVILREFQTYLGWTDKQFVAATIQAIGRCASSISIVTDSCLSGLVSLLSHRDECVVGESVVVVRKLLQTEAVPHKHIIKHMARLLPSIRIATARASILWLLGEHCDKVPNIAPDVLRVCAKGFCSEEDSVKLQILTLATKLLLSNPEQTLLLCQYVYSLAKYDANYDIRDRARLLRAVVLPSGSPNVFTNNARSLFMAYKPPPLHQSSFKDRDQFQLGTLSHFMNARAAGYRDMPSFPSVAPNPRVRDVPGFSNSDSTQRRAEKKRLAKKKNFYSSEEEEESHKKSEEENESEGEEESGDSSGHEEEETSSGSSGEASDAESEEEEKQGQKSKVKPSKVSDSSISSTEGESDSESSSSEVTEADSSTDSDDEASFSEEASSSSEQNNRSEKKLKVPVIPKQGASNLDLLLSLEELPPVLDTPMLTPSLGGFLSPETTDLSAVNTPKNRPDVITPVRAAVSPGYSCELLSKVAGAGLSVSASFTRTVHLYCEKMTAVQLSFTNHSDEVIHSISMDAPANDIPCVHPFPGISNLSPGGMATQHGTLGIDFLDRIQGASFTLTADDRKYQLSLSPPVGELLTPVSMSEALFNKHQASLRGMHEQSANVVPMTVSEDALLSALRSSANMWHLKHSDGSVWPYRLCSQTSSGGSLVLVVVDKASGGDSAALTVTVHCDKLTIASMLLKLLTETLQSQ